jgi:hypothetical protein
MDVEKRSLTEVEAGQHLGEGEEEEAWGTERMDGCERIHRPPGVDLTQKVEAREETQRLCSLQPRD